jgi:hypothetical protein
MSDLVDSADGKTFELLMTIDMGVDAFASNWTSCDRLSGYISRMISHNRTDSLLYSNLFSSALNELLETAFRRHRPGGQFICSVSRLQRRDRIELTIPCNIEDREFYQTAIDRLSRPDAADQYRSALFTDGPIDPDFGLFELALDYNAVLSVTAAGDGSVRLVADLALEGSQL